MTVVRRWTSMGPVPVVDVHGPDRRWMPMGRASAAMSRQPVRALAYRTSGTTAPATSKGSSAPSARKPARS